MIPVKPQWQFFLLLIFLKIQVQKSPEELFFLFPLNFLIIGVLELKLKFDLDKNQSGFGYHMNLLASVTASHPLYRNFSFFAENLISRETELKSYEYYINTGLVFNCNDKIKFDAGVNYGLTRTSSKIYFIGFSYRH